ncbi:CobW family GTP-binding protein [Actinoplanes couchii]|uniref:Cobalamin synthesis protein n=1 Tax=Actinoplanes couchii TaxID=403638 RepID=A0ABQ3XER0_9ACTN|nr:GTP-binding protein [Actinoplanes couchii]MDR6319827.1 G3E family GTPase [Actinoplanes couchii]GID56962.1 putative cobalamin synthesis protein [Actinoplanes couchii]
MADVTSRPAARPSRGGRVPVIGLTGFLGAGKTSLLNHLLRRPGARLGVVVNDFGTLNVDAALVAGQIDDAEAISGGCVCCLPDAGGLDDALQRLSRPRLRLDAILVEASGIAEPIGLARLIGLSPVKGIRPGGIVEVIDAVEHDRTVDLWPEPPARYAAATLVVINKVDLLPPAERDQVIAHIQDRVRQRHPHVQIITARHSRIDPALVFDTAADEDPVDELPLARLIRDQYEDRHDHQHARAASTELVRPVCPDALIDLLEDPPPGAYRIKGRIVVRGSRTAQGYAVNVVGTQIHVTPLPAPPPVGELVAIGMNLDQETTQHRLDTVANAPAERPHTAGLRRLRRYRTLSA